MQWIDTHAHFYGETFEKDWEDTAHRAKEAGLKSILMPNVDHTTIDFVLEAELRLPQFCLPMMGLHPCSVNKSLNKELYAVEAVLNSGHKFYAIGETGTDLYWDKTFFEAQLESLKVHIQWCKSFNLPLVIHCRNSVRETIDFIQKEGFDGLTGVFHCFSTDEQDAKDIIELGFLLGIGGVVTYKNSGLDKVLATVPLEKLVLETDCPYLTPVPHRGKRNEPCYLPLVGEKLASIYQKGLDEIASITTKNAEKLFKLD